MYDTFICHKSEDYPYALDVYELLMGSGLCPFLSELSLPELGKAEFQRQIDLALDAARHLVVVTSSVENVSAGWVAAEWGLFVSEKRAGRKDGNILTVLFGEMTIEQLPLTLRYYEAIRWNMEGRERLLRYLVPAESAAVPRPGVHRSSPAQCSRLHYLVNSLGNRLVEICTEEACAIGQSPSRTLYVCTTCVSNRDYLAFAEQSGIVPRVDPTHPGTHAWDSEKPVDLMLEHPVTWVPNADARKFCEWLTEQERATGLVGSHERYTLPTFEQWRVFSKGARLTGCLVTDRQCVPGQYQPTEPVWWGEPSPSGLLCLFGNVFEWCHDSKTKAITKHYQDGTVREEQERCYLAVGGGWASARSWLERHVGVWCPGGWAMKDGGFRICLASDVAAGTTEPLTSPAKR